VTKLPPEIGPEDGTTEASTALKLTGVTGTIVTFPVTDPSGAGGQHDVLEG